MQRKPPRTFELDEFVDSVVDVKPSAPAALSLALTAWWRPLLRNGLLLLVVVAVVVPSDAFSECVAETTAPPGALASCLDVVTGGAAEDSRSLR
jgi:hypothetical protein